MRKVKILLGCVLLAGVSVGVTGCGGQDTAGSGGAPETAAPAAPASVGAAGTDDTAAEPAPASAEEVTITAPAAEAVDMEDAGDVDAGEADADVPMPAEADAAVSDGGVKEVGNTVCPISGAEVGSMEKGAHVDYNGHRVGLCCSACTEKFMQAPEENLTRAQANQGPAA